MTTERQRSDARHMQQAVLNAGGVLKSAKEGETAFRWQGHPKAFVLLTVGKLTVHFRTRARQVPRAECRAMQGQDCMPVTAAILSNREIAVRATCTAPCRWIELSPTSLIFLVHGDMAFRSALFATHAQRLPTVFAHLFSRNVVKLDCRLAEWLLEHARSGDVLATHAEIASDLMTAREVVSRRLRDFATKGWILQNRGFIRLDAPAALARLSRGAQSACAGSGFGLEQARRSAQR